jgi:hypothetical protein
MKASYHYRQVGAVSQFINYSNTYPSFPHRKTSILANRQTRPQSTNSIYLWSMDKTLITKAKKRS